VPTLLLAPHAYACSTRGHIVLLDLRRDRYFALDPEHSKAFAELFPAGPGCTHDESKKGTSESAPGPVTDMTRALIEAGLVTDDAQQGKRFESPALPIPTRALEDEYLVNEIPIRPRHIVRFVRAYAIARRSLGRRPIESVIESVRQRKARYSNANALNRTSVTQLYTVFERLRPMLYTARDACLFDSFTLMEFLAEHGVAVTWVFGVRAAPFAAHCWIQQGDLVLNDSPEHVRRYTPIMAV
jgi:hypothetical protein